MKDNGSWPASTRILISCTGCRAILDELAKPPRWCYTGEYIANNQSAVDDFVLLESYCPACDLAYDRLLRYGQTEAPSCP